LAKEELDWAQTPRTAWLDNGDACQIDLSAIDRVGWANRSWVRGKIGNKLVNINVDHIVAILVPALVEDE
jgi:hypothetical protein